MQNLMYNPQPTALRWPLGLERLVSIYPGSLVLVSGSPKSGMSTFLLEFAWRNMPRGHSCEAGIHTMMLEGEIGFCLRLQNFEPIHGASMGESFERDDFIFWPIGAKYDHFIADVLDFMRPDDLNIIHGFVTDQGFPKVATILRKIQEILTSGVCVVGIHVSCQPELPRSNSFNQMVPDMAITLDHDHGRNLDLLRLTKATPASDLNLEDLEIFFGIEGEGPGLVVKEAYYKGQPFRY